MNTYESQPSVKKLYGILMKSGFYPFLLDPQFKYILTGHDLDTTWDKCMGQVQSENSVSAMNDVIPSEVEKTLLRFLDSLYIKEDSTKLLKFLDEVLIEYTQKMNMINSGELRTQLNSMDLFSKDEIKKMEIFTNESMTSNIKHPFPKKEHIQEEFDSKKIFVVHGRDEIAKSELIIILKDKLGLEPLILSEAANGGKTVIEKFEANTLKVGYAIIILTPDDIGGLREELDKISNCNEKIKKLKPRARENLILELGYFIGKLQRDRICCIMKGDELLPSDLHGIVTIRYKESIKDKFLDIEKELKSAGYVK